jgi:hypothetical protein
VILSIIKRLFTPLAIACLLFFAWESRQSLADILSSSRPLALLLAVLTWFMMHVLAPAFATIVFKARDFPLSFRTAAEIHVRNLPARYIPGGIWHTVGRVAALRNLGAKQSDIAVFVFLENVLAACTAFLLGGCIVAWFRDMQGWGQIAAFCVAGSVFFLLMSPFILRFRILKGAGAFPIRDYLGSILLVSISWCVGATAFVAYLSAFPELQLTASPLEIGGNYLFSWAVGFVSLFAPQGVGIFEVVLAELMRGSGTLSSFAALIAGFRLVILAADSVAYGALKLLTASHMN